MSEADLAGDLATDIFGASSWSDLYRVVRRVVADANETRWMIEEVSGVSWADLAGADAPCSVPPRARDRLRDMAERRAGGEPLQYVLGRWSFRTLDLMVDRRVLIPRPETEQVVEVALAELGRLERSGRPSPLVVDLGTGSGAIALSIAAENKRAEVWATDASTEALDVARANLAGLAGFAATRVRLAEGDWWAALPADLKGRVDLVVSNPPYISTDEMHTIDPSVGDWEPRTALEAGPSGLEAVEEILRSGSEWLAPGGAAVLEIAPHQALPAVAKVRDAGFAEVSMHRDLAGRDRVLVART